MLLAKDSVFSYPAISECPEPQNKSICISLTIDCYIINCIFVTIEELQAFDLRACNALLGELEKMVEFPGLKLFSMGSSTALLIAYTSTVHISADLQTVFGK